ncbi:MAG: menaquinone biosynthesis protein [Phycisphaerales bacterium]
MEHCTIAAVRYLNTVPLIEGLDELGGTGGGVELVLAAPSRIGPMIRRGEADLGLASIIEASDFASELVLIPSGMIGCDGATMTVRLFSSVPLEEITEVYADTDSRTSVVLCRVLLNRLFGIAPRIVEFDARERVVVGGGTRSGSGPGDEWPPALLLIGDKVVTDSPPAVRYPYQLDLGKAWKELTGLPFVYAMWMCRRDRAEQENITTAAMVLDRQRRHNLTRMEWIIREHAPRHRWPIDLARQYLSGLLRFTVGDAEKAAVTRFFAEIAALEGKPAVVPDFWSRPAALGVG